MDSEIMAASSPAVGGRKELEALLAQLGIHTTVAEHPQVFTVQEMLPHTGHLDGALTKNLFLRDKKRRLWLFSALHDAQVNLGDLAKAIGAASGGLRLADEASLQETLNVGQGCVTALALFNDTAKKVTFACDERLVSGKYDCVYFHPMENSATMGLKAADFQRFLQHIDHSPVLVKLDGS